MNSWKAGIALAALQILPVAADEQIAKLTFDQLAAAPMPAGVLIETRLIDGAPAATITSAKDSPVSVQLAEVPVGRKGKTRISYEATLSSEKATKPAYLELWAVVKGGAYFSRALNDAFTGTQPARQSSTPFFLNPEDTMDSARLGVRFEGPGSITIRGIELWERSSPPGMDLSNSVAGIVGAIVGLGSGIWSVVSSYFVARGQARRMVMGVTAVCATLGAVMLVAGGVLWLQNATWNLWYTLALLGAIVTPVYCAMYATLRVRYRKAEERRMMAMDLQ